MSEESLEPLVTQCPNCATRFRVTETQLQVSSGRVRCGACLAVFEGTQYLSLDGEIIEPADEGDVDALLDELDDIKSREPEQIPGMPTIGQAELSPVSQADLGQVLSDEDALPDELLALEAELLAELRLEAGDEDKDEEDVPTVVDDISVVQEVDSEVAAEDVLGETTAPPDERPKDAWAEDIAEDIWVSEDGDEADRDAAVPINSDTFADALDDVGVSQAGPNAVADKDAVANRETLVHGEATASPDTKPGEEIELQAMAGQIETPPPTARRVNEFEALHLADMEAAAHEDATSKRSWLTYMLIIVGLVALPTQVLWLQYDAWVFKAEYRPIYQNICSVVGCELPIMRDVSQIVSKKVVIRTHPDQPNIRIVDVLIVNNADFAQPYPLIELMATGLRRQLVAGKRYRPDEYLRGDADPEDLLPPRTPVHVSLEIDKPGEDALTFEVRFR